MDLDKAPRLEGWLTFAEAGRKLKVSRQAVFGMVERDELTDVRSIGGPKPIHVVSKKQVTALAKKRRQRQAERDKQRELREARQAASGQEHQPRETKLVKVV